jgi:cyclic beta-1,2-glucan synthetase
LPFDLATQFQALLVLMLFMAPTFDVVDALLPKSSEATVRGHFSALLRDAVFASAQVALRIVLVAHSAWLMGDAIVRTLFRLQISRRNLLEWRTASQAQRAGDNTLAGYYRMMYGAVIIGLAGVAIPLATGSTGAGVAFIFALFWVGSPAFAWLVSRSAETEDRLIVAEPDKAKLRAIGRRTWLYFETFVTPEHNMLPPDNFQEVPTGGGARTAQYRHLPAVDLSARFRLDRAANAAERHKPPSPRSKLESYRGHLYNWYDTKTLRPLLPLYVSASTAAIWQATSRIGCLP